MLPGLGAPLLIGQDTIVYPVSRTGASPWAQMGSPTGARVYRVIVGPGAILSSAVYPDAGMVLGFPAGSTVYLYNSGEIAGAGGAGGQGDRGARHNTESTSFVGGGGGGGTGRPGGAGGVAATEPDSDDDSTDGTAGTDTTPGVKGVNDFGSGIPDGGYTAGTAAQVGGTALDVTTAITVYIVNAAGLIVAGGSGGYGGYQDGPLPASARNPHDGYGPPAGITSSPVESGWAIKLASGATIIPVSGVNSTRVKGAYTGATSA